MGRIARCIAETGERELSERGWQERSAFCAGCEQAFPPSELAPDEAARYADPGNMTERSNLYCPGCLTGRCGTIASRAAARQPLYDPREHPAKCSGCGASLAAGIDPLDEGWASGPTDGEFLCGECNAVPPGMVDPRRTMAALAAASVIDGIGAGLRAAIEREATWRSSLRDNYDDDFGQFLAYSDMYGLAGRLGFATAEDAWEANPTIQGSTDPTDFSVVPDGEQAEMELSAAVVRDPCEDCGSDREPGMPCDCARRPEARQPPLSRAVRAARESLDMGDLVIKESPPSMGGMDVYRKGPDYAEDRGDLDKVTFLNERGMDALGEWITNAGRTARRIAAADGYFVGEMFMPGLRTDPRHEGRMGSIVIGGDRGDVWAASASGDDRGVTLTGVEFRTTLDLSGLSPDELREEAEEVIRSSYESVQEDTFAPTRSTA